MNHILKRKTYDSLNTLKVEIENEGVEKIVEFNGFRLVTNKNVYGIVDSIVYIKTLEEYKKGVRSNWSESEQPDNRRSRTGEEIISGDKNKGKTRNRNNVPKQRRTKLPKK
jgi:hypothetical protein